jgi:hypothetical protein
MTPSRNGSVVFVQDHERLQALSVLARPHCRQQLAVAPREPDLDSSVDNTADQLTTKAGQAVRTAEPALGSGWRQTIRATATGCGTDQHKVLEGERSEARDFRGPAVGMLRPLG